MGYQIPFNEWTIPHQQPLASALRVFVDLVVSKRCLLAALAKAALLLAGAVAPLPVRERSRVNLCAGEQLAERVRQLPHECFVQRLSALGVGEVQTIENSLRNYIVQFLKELLL